MGSLLKADPFYVDVNYFFEIAKGMPLPITTDARLYFGCKQYNKVINTEIREKACPTPKGHEVEDITQYLILWCVLHTVESL